MKKLSLYIFLVLMWCNVGFAEEKNARIERFINQIISSVPTGVQIEKMVHHSTTDVLTSVFIDGIAPSNADIYYFVSDLRSKSLIEYVELISISKQNSDINQSSDLIFKIEVKLKRDE